MSDIASIGPVFTMAEPTILRVADLTAQSALSLKQTLHRQAYVSVSGARQAGGRRFIGARGFGYDILHSIRQFLRAEVRKVSRMASRCDIFTNRHSGVDFGTGCRRVWAPALPGKCLL